MIMLYTPRPTAWNSVELVMPTAASTKLGEMMRSATMPMRSASSDASNSEKICPGKSWKHSIPTIMITSEAYSVSRQVRSMRRLQRAP